MAGDPLRKKCRGLAAHVDHTASEIGTHFPRLTTLDLSRTDISPEGLGQIGRECSLLNRLFLVRCRHMDDSAACVFSDIFPILSKVDLCGTSVSSKGLKLLVKSYSKRTECSGLEIRYAKRTERSDRDVRVGTSVAGKVRAALLNDQFDRLKFLSCFS